MESKRVLREKYLERRLALSAAERAILSDRIQAKALAYLDESGCRPRSVGLYNPIRGEVDTRTLFEVFKERGCAVFYPKVQREPKELHFYSVDSLKDLAEGAYGIPEPRPSVEATSFDVLFVPGLAFDTAGERLGYGTGYFDRLKAFPTSLRAGLAYDFQILPKLPKESHDLSCDLVISEKRILKKERTL